MDATVIEALRRFLPGFLRENPALNAAQRRAVWAITHCRTPTMGGHLHVCEPCGIREFRFHSCNHRSCPQCGKAATAQWVQRQLDRRIGAPYFMVTFTLPAPLRALFFTPSAKEVYTLLFEAASHALRDILADPRWLGAATSGFSLILHTWNQRLLFHPHLHAIVPGAGIDLDGQVVSVDNPNFLIPKARLRLKFRQHFKEGLRQLATRCNLPPVDSHLWHCDWGVKINSFGNGQNAIKYLGAYVCRTAIGDSRIRSITPTHVTFTWKDRAHGDAINTQTLDGVEFVRRYLRHVLPAKLKAVRHFGFCHPSAKKKRQRIAFHTGIPLSAALKEPEPPSINTSGTPRCPCCGQPMKPVRRIPSAWCQTRGPPPAPSLHSHAA